MADTLRILFLFLAAGVLVGAALGLLLYLEDQRNSRTPKLKAESAAERDGNDPDAALPP